MNKLLIAHGETLFVNALLLSAVVFFASLVLTILLWLWWRRLGVGARTRGQAMRLILGLGILVTVMAFSMRVLATLGFLWWPR